MASRRHKPTRNRIAGMRAAAYARLEELPFRTGAALAVSALLVLGAAAAAVVLGVSYALHGPPAVTASGPLGGYPAAAARSHQRDRSAHGTRARHGQPGGRGSASHPAGSAVPGGPARRGSGRTPPGPVTVSTSSRTLAAAPDPANPGQTVTYTAAISVAGSAGGWVAFTDNGHPVPGCGRVTVSLRRTAVCRVRYAGPGSHSVTAVFHPASGHARSSSAVGETVARCGPSYRGCQLVVADLQNADLRGDNLSGATLQGANLAGADLAGADLAGASLAGADLAGATLAGADLADASLVGAAVTGANLSGVHWSDTACPDGTNSSRDGRSCRDDL